MLHRFYDKDKKRYCTDEEAKYLRPCADGNGVERITFVVEHIPTFKNQLKDNQKVLYGYTDNKHNIGVICYIEPAPEIEVEWGIDEPAPDTEQFPMSVTLVTRDGNEQTIHDVCELYVESDGNLEVYDGSNNIVDTVAKEIKIVQGEK